MKRDTLAETLVSLSAILPGLELSEGVLEVYYRALADLNDVDLHRAAAAVLQRDRWFPVPARLRELAAPADPNLEATRVLARLYSLLEHSPVSGPTWRVSRIREELGEAAVIAFRATGGAAHLALLDDPKQGPFVRKAFLDAYGAASSAVVKALPLGPGSGLANPTDERVQALIGKVGRAA